MFVVYDSRVYDVYDSRVYDYRASVYEPLLVKVEVLEVLWTQSHEQSFG